MIRVGWSPFWALATGVVVAACLLVAVIIEHNLRVWRVRRAYRTLPDFVKTQVLGLIEEAATVRSAVTFLRLDKESRCDGDEGLLRSHVGGVPYMEAGDVWPAGSPAKFLAQVRLDEPSLGDTWQGRLVTVFLVFDSEQVVRSYAAPSHDRYVEVPAPVAPCPASR